MMNVFKAAAAAAAALCALVTHAEYPERVIKIVVPYTAGGTTDLLARTVGNKLNEA